MSEHNHRDPDLPIIDPAAWADLGDDDPDLLPDLIAIFLREAPLRCAELCAALAAADYTTVQRAAHTLQNSAAILGAARLRRLAAALDTAARAADHSRLHQLLPDLQPELDSALTALRALPPPAA